VRERERERERFGYFLLQQSLFDFDVNHLVLSPLFGPSKLTSAKLYKQLLPFREEW